MLVCDTYCTNEKCRPYEARELSPGADFVSKLLKARQRVCLEFGLKGQGASVPGRPWRQGDAIGTWSLDE